MDLEEITENKEIQDIPKQTNPQGNLERKINSGYNLIERNFSKAGESTTIAAKLYNGFVNAPAGVLNVGYNTLKNSYKFIVSEDYRSEKVKNYIRGRVYKAKQKGRINTEKAEYLYGHLDKEKISPYLLDFFVHTVVLNVAGWVPVYILLKYYDAGAISLNNLTSSLIFLGPIQRTGWTIGRAIYDGIKKNGLKEAFKKRTVALRVGIWPYIGTSAYLFQIIHSEYEKDKELGDFLLDDSLYGIEKKIPVIRMIRKNIINKIYKD